MYRTGRSSYRKPVRRAKSATRVVRRRKSLVGAQTDIKTHRLEGTKSGGLQHTFTASSLATPVLWNPLSEAYNSSFFTDHVKLMYQQWRIKSVRVRIGFDSLAQTAGGNGLIQHTLTTDAQKYSGVRLSYVWDRQESYANVTGLTSAVILSRLGSKIVRYLDNQIPSFTTSIRAGASDKGWLDVDAAPAAAPNTNAFWCPFLFLAATTSGGNCTGNLYNWLEYEITVECRGSKL